MRYRKSQSPHHAINSTTTTSNRKLNHINVTFVTSVL